MLGQTPLSARHIVGLQASFNIRLKIKRMLAKGDIDLASHTVTEADEAHLLSPLAGNYVTSSLLEMAFLQPKPFLQNLGNAPAEANHASIVARIGSLVMEPVTLIESLMGRHLSISSERNHCISVRHVQCQALAVQSTDVATREALKGLSSWGFELYKKATKHSQRLHHRKNQDGSHHFAFNHGLSPLTLAADTEASTCAAWVAMGGTTQESSAEQQLGLDHPPEGEDDMSMRYCGFGDEDVSRDKEDMLDGEEACSFAREEVSRREHPATSQEVHAVSRADNVPYRGAQSGKYNLRELYQIFQDLAHCINKVRDPTTKDLLVGTALKQRMLLLRTWSKIIPSQYWINCIHIFTSLAELWPLKICLLRHPGESHI
ncbi:hypothetical protein IV203_038395 [Nitzschia inconspicua]|uniref:Uncharacterized protein n=1 Tax=Nitzschia inconspicua TaxID=303405 RepID=A0A9K3LNI3_9STRA|nr:hypothetical protein IV203_038395 [Nitzschia inconspicua]